VAIFRIKSGFIVQNMNAFSFLSPTTFGAEYCLTHAITHHPPKTYPLCSAVSLRQLSYLLVSRTENGSEKNAKKSTTGKH